MGSGFVVKIVEEPFTSDIIVKINHEQCSSVAPIFCEFDHGGRNVVMIARKDGMHCSIPECNYRQRWAYL
jgi:hypothetical protein